MERITLRRRADQRYAIVFREFSPNAIKIITRGGLGGGISIALALSLPAGQVREVIVSVTYIVAVFSIRAQGLSLGFLVRSWGREDGSTQTG